MKKIITAFIFCFLCGECFSQAGEWVWIKGDSIPNQPGNYGVQGVPSPTNNPPSLYESCEWTDLNGNFWLFSGLDMNNFPLADLWKYDPTTNEWTWMKGPGTPFPLPVFGTQGIPSPLNNPAPGDYGAPTFVDLQGNLWLGTVNLWKYDIAINQWTWMNGPGAGSYQGVYGIQGIPDSANYPGGRTECVASWTDNAGDLWLFGGAGGNNVDPYNDLWRYNIASNQWAWMKGDSTVSAIGNYGILGIEAATNDPPARWSYSHWKDSSGKLWFFGGGFIPSPTNNYYFNDLWRYNPITNNWTWMGGNNYPNATGTYGTKCVTDTSNIPDSRIESRSAFIDISGNFWLFGGAGTSLTYPFGQLRNDLWKYCVVSNQWIWINGDSITNPIGNWGILGISNPSNKPNGRGGCVAWTDNNGHFYLFGGSNAIMRFNDLWKYTIDTTCGICPAPTSIQENNFTNELLIFPNPTNSSFTISFSSSEKQSVELRIYNTLGKQVYVEKEAITKGKFEKEINVEKWSEGIYFLQVKTKDGNMSRKVIVSHL